MTIYCSRCAYNNPDTSPVCLNCGQSLQQISVSPDGLSQPNASGTGAFQPGYPPPPPPGGNTASFVPQAPQAPQAANIPVRAQQFNPPILQMGAPYADPHSPPSGTHAFAGFGVLVAHQSWLLSERAELAGEMLVASHDIFDRRQILGLNVGPRNLQESSGQPETRHYLILRRGVTTIFLYIAPAGRDLYISRATTVLTSIDSFRVFSLIALIAIGFICLISIILILATIPIAAYLTWFFYRSFRYWLRERDFWVYLRKNELNDFQLDDIALLEHVTDETLRAAAERLKLNPDKIVAPTKGYEHERKIKVV